MIINGFIKMDSWSKRENRQTEKKDSKNFQRISTRQKNNEATIESKMRQNNEEKKIWR